MEPAGVRDDRDLALPAARAAQHARADAGAHADPYCEPHAWSDKSADARSNFSSDQESDKGEIAYRISLLFWDVYGYFWGVDL